MGWAFPAQAPRGTSAAPVNRQIRGGVAGVEIQMNIPPPAPKVHRVCMSDSSPILRYPADHLVASGRSPPDLQAEERLWEVPLFLVSRSRFSRL